MPQLLQKEGLLLKRSKGRGTKSVAKGISWAEVNCVLKSGSNLKFFDEEEELKSEYVVNETTRVITIDENESDGIEHCFCIYTSGQEESIILAADNAAEKQSWITFFEQFQCSLLEKK